MGKITIPLDTIDLSDTELARLARDAHFSGIIGYMVEEQQRDKTLACKVSKEFDAYLMDVQAFLQEKTGRYWSIAATFRLALAALAQDLGYERKGEE